MRNLSALFVSLILSWGSLAAQEGTVTPLLSKAVAGVPGKELSMITVDYPPGASDQVHRHHAQAVVYVLDGVPFK
jgi:quercetin dioxygenase-like cupin family protein